MIQNKFKIIIPSYNNEEWVEYNLASVLNQTYTNYEVLYIDDCSTDSTLEKVKSIASDNNKFKIIHNETNMGAMYNYFEHLDDIPDDTIIIHLDGDDWLIDETILDKLNKLYNETDCWMTYGKFVVWHGDDQYSEPYPQNTEYHDFVHTYKFYRRDLWRPSHLRTYRCFLLKAINKHDMCDLESGKYYWHASDLSFQYPCMEMAGKDKIVLADFFTSVYNQHPNIVSRTRQRESVDNSKYEVEIRNLKVYDYGLDGIRLPQINVVGDYRERNSIPTKFSYVYNRSDGVFDATLIQDGDIIRYINGDIQLNHGKVVADIHEPPHLLQQKEVYDAVYDNYDKFDRIFTFDSKLLSLPNAVFRNGGYEVVLNKNVHKQEYPSLADDSLIKLYDEKPHHISFITSNKTMTYGHNFRNECVTKVIESGVNGVDIFGVGIREIVGKIEALKEYKFSVAMENGVYDNYFTEKILDCFLTGTVPIYWGCDNIGDFFDVRGMYIFKTEDELIDILSNLTDDDYYSKMEYIKTNFEKALTYYYNNDTLFDKFIKDLI
jgi:hypothetical protein